ncbi:MAG: OmpA family protein [Polyangiaceae bacterium]|nr:OmpA family protein [Polyangiaceae bacterium]
MDHRSQRWIATWALALALSMLATLVGAQEAPAFSLDVFQPTPAGDRFFAVQGGDPGGKAAPRVMLFGDYAYRPLVAYENDGDDTVGAVVSSRFLLHAGGGVMLADRLKLSLDLPFLLGTGGEDQDVGAGTIASPSGAAVGDLRLLGRVELVGKPRSPFQLGIGGSLWLPTGDETKMAGTDGVRGMPTITAAGEVGDLVYAANVGVLLQPSADVMDSEVGSQLAFGVGVAGLLADDRVQLGPELYGTTGITGDDALARPTTNLEALLGLRVRVAGFVFGLGVGPGITKGIGTPALRLVGSIVYAPEPKAEPEPVDRDRDDDGVLDEDDACVDDPGEPSDDLEVHGCPDTDGDGIRDPKDACIEIPGEESDDPEKNGCPPDRDGDGILDDDDACPDRKGEASDDAEKNGCPPDRDGDGVYDEDDACPDEPGKKSSDPEKNGCPVDTDGDGILDPQDACPNEKGKPDPDPEKNGCPKLVRVTAERIVILQQVQFRTGSDVILPESAELLSEVAAVLGEHSEILKIAVEGHTDNRGNAAYNKKLSERRAASVVKWLTTKHEIDSGRLEARGYGLDQPIDSNDTDAGRQRNRRVEFKILESKPRTTEEQP